MELNVIAGLTVLLLMVVLGGLFVVIAARSGATANFDIALEQQGLEWTVVVAICLVGLGGLTAGAMVGAPLLGDGATVASVAGGTLFLAGTGIAGLAIGRYQQYRRLTSADSTIVQGCAVGDTVVLTGTVDSDGDLVAPCTETPCVAYDARIETQVRIL